MYLIIHCSNCTFTQTFSHKFGFGEGASKFLGGPVSFQIYWPPGPLHPQA